MNNLCTDIGYHSVNHVGEQLCGDHIDVVPQGDDSTVVVLADGLGSGVKACILSTLTAKIISTMMANNMTIENCVETIASTLPICAVRNIAYSTFTIIRVVRNEYAEIIEFDNPLVILLREGKNHNFHRNTLQMGGKTIYQSKVYLMEGDAFIGMSDGAIHAGIGMSLNYGWQRDDIIEFMEMMYEDNLTAKTLSTVLLDECVRLYDNKPGDDTTICAIKIRQRRQINLMIGPPSDPADLSKMQALFFSKEGKHIVCGGTTSTLAAEYLGKPIDVSLDYLGGEIPPICKIEGIDLVTEGVITFSKVLQYAKDYLEGNEQYFDWRYSKDGASQIAKLLLEEATDINFFVGRAINPAHQNPNLPINFNIKMQLVEEVSACLTQMGKRIKVSYF